MVIEISRARTKCQHPTGRNKISPGASVRLDLGFLKHGIPLKVNLIHVDFAKAMVMVINVRQFVRGDDLDLLSAVDLDHKVIGEVMVQRCNRTRRTEPKEALIGDVSR